MPNKDKSERLGYFNEELRKQNEKLDFHSYHKIELSYALKWIELNKKAMAECSSQIKFLENRIRNL
jgi:hypothetical protein